MPFVALPVTRRLDVAPRRVRPAVPATTVLGVVAFAVLAVVARLPAPAPELLEGVLSPGAPAAATPPVAPVVDLARLVPPDTVAAVAANAVVVRPIDGDTLVVALGRREETVRLLAIDTPETHRPATPVECFGPEAAAALAGTLPPGTPVRLERDVEARDRYGRLLAYVVRAGDGLHVNLALARAGLADALAYAPNVAIADAVAEAVQAARTQRRGLWGACGSAHDPAGR